MSEDERLDGITDSTNISKLREMVKDREAWRAAVHGVTESDLVTEQQQQSLREVLRETRGNGVYFCYRCPGPTPSRMVSI